MSDIPFDERVRFKHVLQDGLVALAVDTVLFGLFAGAYAALLWSLITHLKSGPRHHVPAKISSAVVLFLMFVIAFAYLGVDAATAVFGFVDNSGDLDLMALGLTDTAVGHWDLEGMFLFMQIALASFFMVYRLFEVWGRNIWVAVLPALLSLATFGAGVSMLAKLFHYSTNYPADVRTTLFYALSSATTGLCAVLIIGRLITRKSRLASSLVLPRAAAVIADIFIRSAVVYVAATIGLAVYMASDLSRPRPKWIIGGMPSFIGVTFSTIVLWELKMLKTEPEDEDTEKLNIVD
ncbi:hypothetical protein L226DRAFT_572933 [Lentinus tigrinus ALCF2SS1-7]|uniref:uncharacterized protein n=1 Tax=Lentinus tigrinus ALCF2SS1-7 TaxID=1328758 RepID=UPI0011663686|nr:hypothetical protein L226DRAFT_572933 [Lentinus tigrinus ALCF2SS1-7]